ncbi:hypothetical protein IP69_06360 [Bosea sp. AAP35]|uniref:hypothetical protein n=1 Tax=Bosea sp. AAP35 TaxID=1523417 RepID=UPI0006B8CEAF|nr:hypothetical protein [Bosea sp. AAP35]KPF71503.1 hypothetical protein IP69_06360 [Bosea sp. AAP35]
MRLAFRGEYGLVVDGIARRQTIATVKQALAARSSSRLNRTGVLWARRRRRHRASATAQPIAEII